MEKSLVIFSARKQFLMSAVNMGWQLAITVLVPVMVGAWLDTRYHTTPSYTLAALVLACAMAVVVVANTIKQVSQTPPKAGKK